jgi:epoxide hydrolase 4
MPHEQTERFVEINGIELHVIEAGRSDGEPILLLHGFPEFWWAWRNQISVLAEAGFHVIVPDLRGYGQSSAPPGWENYTVDKLVSDVVELAAALQVGRFNLVGHDWGGIIAWALAARHPVLVHRLVILNAPHLDVVQSVLKERPTQILKSSYIGFFQLPMLPERVLAARSFKVLRMALSHRAKPGTFTPIEINAYQTEWQRPGRLGAMINYYRALARRRPALLGRIVPPTLIIWGCKDTALDYKLAESSLLQCANGRMLTHRNASHWLHLEEPDWVNDNLVQYLLDDHELDRPDPGTFEATG